MSRILVVLKPPRRVSDFLVFAKSIATSMREDPLFSPPAPLLTGLDADIAAFEAALVAVRMRKVDASAKRKATQTALLVTLQNLQAYVQTLTDAEPRNAARMVFQRAGMGEKNAKGPTRAALVVKQGRVSGSAHAYARAARLRAMYEWHYALQGEPWIALPRTRQADTLLEGLVPGVAYDLRVRAVTRHGPSEWVEPVRFSVA